MSYYGDDPVSDKERAAWGLPDWKARAETAEADLTAEKALTALVLDKLELAGGTLDEQLRFQLIHDLQTEIRVHGGQISLDYWRTEVSMVRAERDKALAANVALRDALAETLLKVRAVVEESKSLLAIVTDFAGSDQYEDLFHRQADKILEAVRALRGE